MYDPSHGGDHRPPVGYLLLGAVAVPLAVLAAMLVVYVLDSRCGTPGDSGGCEMGIAMTVLSACPSARCSAAHMASGAG